MDSDLNFLDLDLDLSFGTHIEVHNYADFLPVEIFSEIFLYTVQVDPRSQQNLMLVCRRWHKIMIETPHSRLRIRRSTRKQDIERFRRRWLLDVTIDMSDERDGILFNPDWLYESFMAAAQAASRWRSLELASLPLPGQCMSLSIVKPLQQLESVGYWTSSMPAALVEKANSAYSRSQTAAFCLFTFTDRGKAL
jgi:hypothetical protein